jgi:hypothetical protein
MTPQTPRILEGPSPTVAMNSLDEFNIRTNGSAAERIEALYRTGNADVVHAAGGEMFEAMKILKAANPQQYQAANSAEYPRSPFAQHLRQIAQAQLVAQPPEDHEKHNVGRHLDPVQRRAGPLVEPPSALPAPEAPEAMNRSPLPLGRR